jgi:hypothetical protein
MAPETSVTAIFAGTQVEHGQRGLQLGIVS